MIDAQIRAQKKKGKIIEGRGTDGKTIKRSTGKCGTKVPYQTDKKIKE